MIPRRAIIITLVIFSTPFCTPKEQISTPTTTTMNIYTTNATGWLNIVPNMLPTSSTEAPANLPVAISTK